MSGFSKEVIEKQSAIFGPTHPVTLDTMFHLAGIYRDTDQPSESIALFEKIFAHDEAAFGPEHYSGIAMMMIWFAEACQRAGKLAQADRLLHEARWNTNEKPRTPSPTGTPSQTSSVSVL